MALTINTNLEAMNASRNLNSTENMLATSMQRLSSGLRINSAADDVAGYAISQSLQSQVNGLDQATQNIQDAVALAQTAQGALNDVSQMLQRVRELAVQYANGTTSEEDKTAIEGEVKQLVDEIQRRGSDRGHHDQAVYSDRKRSRSGNARGKAHPESDGSRNESGRKNRKRNNRSENKNRKS